MGTMDLYVTSLLNEHKLSASQVDIIEDNARSPPRRHSLVENVRMPSFMNTAALLWGETPSGLKKAHQGALPGIVNKARPQPMDDQSHFLDSREH